MEEHRNKVVNYQPINPRILVNLPAKLTKNEPYRGGHGAYPAEPSRDCISPPLPLGAMGNWGCRLEGTMGWPKAQWPPSGRYTLERRRGEYAAISPPVP